MFPTTPGPTGATMNYTVVVGGGWILLCVAYYYFPKYGGIHWFTGPVANIQREHEGGSVEVVTELIEDKKTIYSD